MVSRRKPKPNVGAPEVCTAIRRVREASRLTQQAFAEKLGTAVMTLSKWENGIRQPRDPEVFRRLWGLAATAGLAVEQKLFEERIGGRPPFPEGIQDISLDQKLFAEATSSSALVMRMLTRSEWRLMYGFRLANGYLPQVANAVQDALRPALELLDEIIREEAPADSKLDVAFYNRLALRFDELAARKAFPHKFPKERER
jgi:transcriptional regulator with XRE-family HTH domain